MSLSDASLLLPSQSSGESDKHQGADRGTEWDIGIQSPSPSNVNKVEGILEEVQRNDARNALARRALVVCNQRP